MKKFLFLFLFVSKIFTNIETPDVYFHEQGKLAISKPEIKIAILALEPNIAIKKLKNAIITINSDPSIMGIILLANNDTTLSLNSKCLFLHDEIKNIKQQKPVVGYIAEYSSIGEYFILSACNNIFAAAYAQLFTLTVDVHLYRNSNKYYQIKPQLFVAGKYKGYWEYDSELTDDMLSYVKNLVYSKYLNACTQIAQDRNLNIDERSTWASGNLITAQDALDYHLIDDIGSYLKARDNLVAQIKQQHPEINNTETVTEILFDIKKEPKEKK